MSQALVTTSTQNILASIGACQIIRTCVVYFILAVFVAAEVRWGYLHAMFPVNLAVPEMKPLFTAPEFADLLILLLNSRSDIIIDEKQAS